MTVVNAENLLAERDFVRALAQSLLGDAAGADDVVQQAMMLATRQPSPEPKNLRSWLSRVVRNRVSDQLRSDKRRRDRERVAAQHEALPSAQDVLEREEQRQRVVDAVLGLPEPYRGVVLACYWDRRSAADIAKQLSIPAGTVRAQLKRGRDMLRETLEHDGGPDWRFALLPLAASPAGLAAAGVATGAGAATLTPALPGLLLIMTKFKTLLFVLAAVALVWVASQMISPSVDVAVPIGSGDAQSEGEVDPSSTADEDHERVRVPKAPQPERVGRTAVPETGKSAAVTRILVRAVDATGRGIPKAQVDAVDHAGLGAVESDRRGSAVLVIEDGLAQRLVSADPVLFRVCASGFATRFVPARPALGADTDLGELTMQDGGRVSGRVVDGRGRVLGGIFVCCAQVSGDAADEGARKLGPPEKERRIAVMTGPVGSYDLAGLPAGHFRVWGRSADDRWSFTAAFELLAAGVTQAPDLVMLDGAASQAIHGVVTGPNGAAVPGAVIGAMATVAGRRVSARVEADNLGRFELDPIGAGGHTLEAFHPEAAALPALTRNVRPGDRDVTLQLQVLQRGRVEIVDTKTGEPIVNATLQAVTEERGSGITGAAERPSIKRLEDGALEVPVPFARVQLRVRASGYRDAVVGPMAREELLAGQRVLLERLPHLRGRVSTRGRPVVGAEVSVQRVLGESLPLMIKGLRTRLEADSSAYVVTDQEGRFEHPLNVQAEDATRVLLVKKAGFAAFEHPLGALTGEVDGIEIELTEGGSLEGAVLVPDGMEPRTGVVTASNGDGQVLVVRADAEGRFRLDNLAPGPWQVRHRREEPSEVISVGGMEEAGPYAGDCEIREGAVTRFDVEVAPDRWIRGQLVVDGQPASGWSARLEEDRLDSAESIQTSAVLDGYGAFELKGDALSTHSVLHLEKLDTAAGGTLRLRHQLAVSSAPMPIDLRLSTGRIDGVLPAGSQLQFLVGLEGDWLASTKIEVGASGTFSVTVPAGSVGVYEFSIGEDGRKQRESLGQVDVAAGETQTLRSR